MTHGEFESKAEKMFVMLNNIHKTNRDIVFTDELKAIISEIAEYSRGKGLYKRMYKTRKNDFQSYLDLTAGEISWLMIERVASSPMMLLAYGAVEIHAPIIDDKLNGRFELSPPTEWNEPVVRNMDFYKKEENKHE